MKRLFLIVCLSSSFLVSVVNQGTRVEAADPYPVKPISIIIPMKAFETAKRDPEFEKHVLAQNSLPWHLPPDLFINSCDKERETFRRVLAKAGLLKEK